MNKTIVKILTAALAAAMMIGAAGCGSKNTNTNTQSSAQTEGSVVSAAESTEASKSESKASEDTKEESRQGIDLNTLTEDKIRSIVKGTFPENNNAEYVISIIDDGSEYGYAVVSMAREENGMLIKYLSSSCCTEKCMSSRLMLSESRYSQSALEMMVSIWAEV